MILKVRLAILAAAGLFVVFLFVLHIRPLRFTDLIKYYIIWHAGERY